MPLYDSPDLLARCRRAAGQPADDDLFQDADWYAYLTDAQAQWTSTLAALMPDVLVGPAVLLASNDGGQTYGFGLSADGTPVQPLGHATLFRDAASAAQPDGAARGALTPGVDFLVEAGPAGVHVRFPVGMATGFPSGGPWARFAVAPGAIDAAHAPTILPAVRALLVLEAVQQYAMVTGRKDPGGYLLQQQALWLGRGRGDTGLLGALRTQLAASAGGAGLAPVLGAPLGGLASFPASVTSPPPAALRGALTGDIGALVLTHGGRASAAPVAASLTLSATTLALTVGVPAALTATPKTAAGTAIAGAVAWTSSAPTLATIGSMSGLITPVAGGQVTFTATFTNPDGSQVTATCQGTVSAVAVAPGASTLPTITGISALLMTDASATNAQPSLTVDAAGAVHGVARGSIPFADAAGAQPSDLATYAAFNEATNAEVPMFVRDLGDRHPSGNLRSAMVEIAASWPAGGSAPTFRLAPSTPAVARAAEVGFQQITTNVPAVSVDPADARYLHLDNGGFYYKRVADDVGAWAPGRVAVDITSATDNGTCVVPRDPSQYRLLGFAIYMNTATGVPVAVFVGSQGGGSVVGTSIPPLGWDGQGSLTAFTGSYRTRPGLFPLVPLCAMYAWLSPGTGSFIPGTTPWTDPMVAKLSTTGVVITPDSAQNIQRAGPQATCPNYVPPAILTATPAYIRAANFLPLPTTSAADAAAVNASFAAIEHAAATCEDDLWAFGGSWGGSHFAGGAVYHPSLRKYTQFVRSEQLRHLRRSYTDLHPWRTYLVPVGKNIFTIARSDGTSYVATYAQEPLTDAGLIPWQYLTTGDPAALAQIEEFVLDGESKQFSYGESADANGWGNDSTWRWLMHVFQGLSWMHRLSIRTTAGAQLPADYPAGSWKMLNLTATGTVARMQRAASYYHHHMGPGRGLNAALTHVQQSGYGPAQLPPNTPTTFPGVGPFMLGLMNTHAVIGQAMLAPADRSTTLGADMLATYEYLMQAKVANSSVGLGYYRDPAGTVLDALDAFEYADCWNPPRLSPDGTTVVNGAVGSGDDRYATNQLCGPGSQELNGTHLPALYYLLTTVATNDPLLTPSMVERLYVAIQHGMTSGLLYTGGKASSEAHLFSYVWPAVRGQFSIPRPVADPLDALAANDPAWSSDRMAPSAVTAASLTFGSAASDWQRPRVDTRDRWLHVRAPAVSDPQAGNFGVYVVLGGSARLLRINPAAGTIITEAAGVSAPIPAGQPYVRFGYVTATNCLTMQTSADGVTWTTVPGLTLAPVAAADVGAAASAFWQLFKDGTDVAGHAVTLDHFNA